MEAKTCKTGASLWPVELLGSLPIRRPSGLLRLRRMQDTTPLAVRLRSPIPLRFRLVQTTSFTSTSSHLQSISRDVNENDNVSPEHDNSLPSGDYFVTNAMWIGAATLTSKILGLVREIAMASVFGIGPVATAYKYASVLPGFAVSLLGGVNGPIHVTAAAFLSKLPKDRQRKLFQHISIIMFMLGGAASVLIFVFSELIVPVYAPGLLVSAEGRITRELAIKQLRIMTPCIFLAGPVGLGYGYMSAGRNNVLPSISPALSSLVMIGSCVIYTLIGDSNASFSGGILISSVASLGMFLQWILQVTVLCETWTDIIPDSWVNMLHCADIPEFFSLLLPAALSSGLAQIASFTDLYFASLLPGAAAGLSYAYLLIMAPMGLLSSMIILPLRPIFAKWIKTASWSILVEDIKRGVLLCMVVLLPILSVMYILAEPIISILFQRKAFDSSASALVSSLFRYYSLGSPFLLVRELLVAVFYALGDPRGPFLVSIGAITLNAVLDWLLASKYHGGAQGLALSTSLTSALSVLILFHILQRKLRGSNFAGTLSYSALMFPTLLLSSCCVISSFSTFISYKMASTITLRLSWFREVLAICFASSFGIIAFFLPVIILHSSGFELVKDFPRTFIKSFIGHQRQHLKMIR